MVWVPPENAQNGDVLDAPYAHWAGHPDREQSFNVRHLQIR